MSTPPQGPGSSGHDESPADPYRRPENAGRPEGQSQGQGQGQGQGQPGGYGHYGQQPGQSGQSGQSGQPGAYGSQGQQGGQFGQQGGQYGQPGQPGQYGQQGGQYGQQGGQYGQQGGQYGPQGQPAPPMSYGRPGQPMQYGQPAQYGQSPWGSGDQPQPWNANQPPSSNRNKVPFIIGGAAVLVVVLGLIIFLVLHNSGKNDVTSPPPTTSSTSTDGPTTSDTQPTSASTAPNTTSKTGSTTTGTTKLAAAKGVGAAITTTMQKQKYQCSDLVAGSEGVVRGCFQFAGQLQSEVSYQFDTSGNVASVDMEFSSFGDDKSAAKNAALGAVSSILNPVIGSSDAASIRSKLNSQTTQEDTTIGYGDLSLQNEDDIVRIEVDKKGAEAIDVPDSDLGGSQNAVQAALKGKGYTCQTTLCSKGSYESVRYSVSAISTSGSGVRSVFVSVSGKGGSLKEPATDVLSPLNGQSAGPVKSYVLGHLDGGQYEAYVGGFKVQIKTIGDADYQSLELQISPADWYF